MTLKSIETIVPDIYSMLSSPKTPDAKNLEKLGEDIKQITKDRLEKTYDSTGKPTLRMSNIGKPLRKLWMDNKYPVKESTSSVSEMRFLFGNIIEALLIFLIKESGHSYTDEQKTVTLGDLVGHIDGKIDGKLVDIKSASQYSYKTFKTMGADRYAEYDDFGYLGQMSAYAEAEGQEDAYQLFFNKSSGELLLLHIPKEMIYKVSDKIQPIRDALASDTVPPDLCNPEIEEKNGNKRIAKGCTFCQHKYRCFPDVRVFEYSKGPEYFSKVVKEPNVLETF